jgi:predicted flavoprotein YhiN
MTTEFSQKVILHKPLLIVFERSSAKNFEIKTQSVVLEIQKLEKGYKIITKEGEILTDYVIYTTGSSPKSLKMIENLGHKIVSPVPSLFTFNIKNDVLNDLMGTSFPYAEVSIPKLKMEESGPLLITHWGLSGPAILNFLLGKPENSQI